MRETDETTRQRIREHLREEPAPPSALAVALEITPGAAMNHLEHVSRSIEATDEQLLVAPPTCRDCGFDDFDDLLNRPSRCPACKSEAVDEPAFTIEPAAEF